MLKMLFLGSLTLIKVWAVGFFGFHAGGVIHIILALAIITIVSGFIIKKLLSHIYTI